MLVFSFHPTIPYCILIYCVALLYTHITNARKTKIRVYNTHLFSLSISFITYIILYLSRFFQSTLVLLIRRSHTLTLSALLFFSLCPSRIFHNSPDIIFIHVVLYPLCFYSLLFLSFYCWFSGSVSRRISYQLQHEPKYTYANESHLARDVWEIYSVIVYNSGYYYHMGTRICIVIVRPYVGP